MKVGSLSWCDSRNHRQENLATQGYHVSKVSRMLGENKQTVLVLIKIDREFKYVYNISHCCELSIEVEPLKDKTSIIQC